MHLQKYTLILFILVGVGILFSNTLQAQSKNKLPVGDTIITPNPKQKGLEHWLIRDRAKRPAELGNMLKGKKEGQWFTLHPKDSLLQSITIYKEGLKQGAALTFDKQMRLTTEENYVDDQLHGVRRTFKHGKTTLIENYDKGILDGWQYKYYAQGGKLEQETFFKQGEKDGIAKWYYDNEQLLTQYNYKNGVIDGEVKSYYKSGAIKSEVLYKNNNMEGSYKKYHENGQVKAEGKYKKGKKDGAWKEYDEVGKALKTKQYKEGELKK